MTHQVERMVRRNRIEHVAGNVGDTATVPVPLVDRDRRNIMGVIVDRDNNDMYRIAVCAGLFKGKYSRNQFDVCVHKLLTGRDVSQDRQVPPRNAVQMQSKCGGQGF